MFEVDNELENEAGGVSDDDDTESVAPRVNLEGKLREEDKYQVGVTS